MDVFLDVDLTVEYSDSDGDSMDITFYLNDTPIGTVYGGKSNTKIQMDVGILEPNTNYEWYVVVDYGTNITTSEVWSFRTGEKFAGNGGGSGISKIPGFMDFIPITLLSVVILAIYVDKKRK